MAANKQSSKEVAPRFFDFDPRKIPPEYQRAIGQIITAYALLESTVQDAIAGMLELSQVEGWALTMHINGPTRDHILKSVAEIKLTQPADMDELHSLLDEMNAASKLRNEVVHSTWATDTASKQIGYLKGYCAYSVDLEFEGGVAERLGCQVEEGSPSPRTRADAAAFSRRFSSSSTASRMNEAIRFGPTSASMRSRVSGDSRTFVSFTFNGGRPMRP